MCRFHPCRRCRRGSNQLTDSFVEASGEASHRIFSIGAVRRACDWETTSVPDIARHAQQLARAIVRG